MEYINFEDSVQYRAHREMGLPTSYPIRETSRLKQNPKGKICEETKMNKPEKVFRSGPIQATIWSNASEQDGKTFDYRTVSLERTYKDKNGAWQKTNSFRVTDLPRAELVLRKSYEFSVLGQNEEGVEA